MNYIKVDEEQREQRSRRSKGVSPYKPYSLRIVRPKLLPAISCWSLCHLTTLHDSQGILGIMSTNMYCTMSGWKSVYRQCISCRVEGGCSEASASSGGRVYEYSIYSKM